MRYIFTISIINQFFEVLQSLGIQFKICNCTLLHIVMSYTTKRSGNCGAPGDTNSIRPGSCVGIVAHRTCSPTPCLHLASLLQQPYYSHPQQRLNHGTTFRFVFTLPHIVRHMSVGPLLIINTKFSVEIGKERFSKILNLFIFSIMMFVQMSSLEITKFCVMWKVWNFFII